MERFEFLSDPWIAAAEEIHAEYIDRLEVPPYDVRINIVVTDRPGAQEPLHGHIDTTSGKITPAHGHLDDPEVTIYVDFATAYGLFVANDIDATITAFMQGQIEVDGDITRLLLLQELEPSADQLALGNEVTSRVAAITAPVNG